MLALPIPILTHANLAAIHPRSMLHHHVQQLAQGVMKVKQAMANWLQVKRRIPCTAATTTLSRRSRALPLPSWQLPPPVAGMPAHHAGSPMWRSCLQSQGCLPLPLQQLLWLQLRGGGRGRHMATDQRTSPECTINTPLDQQKSLL